MKKNTDTHDNISVALISQYKLPTNSPKLNGHSKSPKSIFEDGCWNQTHNRYVDKYASILGGKASNVYMCIARYADNKENTANPSIQTISHKMGMGRNKAIESIKYLTFWGIINKIITPRNKSNQYQLIHPDDWLIPSEVNQKKFKVFKSCSLVTGLQVVYSRDSKKTYIKKTYKEKYIKESFDIYSSKRKSLSNSKENKSNGHKKTKAKITLRRNKKTTYNHTPYRSRDYEYQGTNGNESKVEISTNSIPLEERSDEDYMTEWRALSDEKRWLHDLRSAAFRNRGSGIKFNIHQETEELNALRVLAFKKKWKNERGANVYKKTYIQN